MFGNGGKMCEPGTQVEGRKSKVKLNRIPQDKFGRRIESAINSNESVTLMGPTGLGKTRGYLVPALRSPHRTLITTVSKAHVDQIAGELDRAGIDPELWAVLKGHDCYACTDDETLEELPLADRQKVQAWLSTTMTGELTELQDVTNGTRALLSRTTEECLDARCCHKQATQRAVYAKVVVMPFQQLLQRYRYGLMHMAPLELNKMTPEGSENVVPFPHTLIVDECHLAEGAVRLVLKSELEVPGIQAQACKARLGDHLADTYEAMLSERDRLEVNLKYHLRIVSDLYEKHGGLDTRQLVDDWVDSRCEARGRLQEPDHSIRKACREYRSYRNKLALTDQVLDLLSRCKPYQENHYGSVTTVVNSTQEDYFVDLEVDKVTVNKTFPEEMLDDVYAQFDSVIQCSATPKGEYDSFGTPFDYSRLNIIDTLPASPTYKQKQANPDVNRKHNEAIADKIHAWYSKPGNYGAPVIILTSSKDNAWKLRQDIERSLHQLVTLEGNTDTERMRALQSLKERGGIGIFWTWHGIDIPGHKLLIIERAPTKPPSRGLVAQARNLPRGEALYRELLDTQNQILQGFGRGLRTEHDTCDVICSVQCLPGTKLAFWDKVKSTTGKIVTVLDPSKVFHHEPGTLGALDGGLTI